MPPIAFAGDPRRRLHERAQQPRRESEAAARQLAVGYVEQAGQQGVSATQAAQHLGVPSRTIRHWRSEGETTTTPCRGRPPKTCSAARRNEVIRFLREVSGPAVGLAALRVLFRDVPRCILENILRRFRRVWRRRHRKGGFRLTWLRAGTVWAIDFSEACHPIDGVKRYLFAVRDLASHQQLAWHPLNEQTAEETRIVLEDLFRRHGPPLVIKSDNGSAFIADSTLSWIRSWSVLQLFNPARHPQYNGALERSNGTLKTYTHQSAIREGHPFRWTSDDVEQARHLANNLSRPWGHRGPTPEEAWQARTPISDDDRVAFLDAVARHQSQAREDLGLDPSAELSRYDQARLDRLAISRALVELGHLRMDRVDRPARKAKRLSRAELAQRAAAHPSVTASAPRLGYTPTGADVASPAIGAPGSVATESDVADAPRAATAARATCVTGGNARRVPEAPTGELALRRARRSSATLPALPTDTTYERHDGQQPGSFSLAMLEADATMRQQTGAEVTPSLLASAPRPAHRERPHPSWLRRLLTLIISRVKAAIISRV